MVGAHRHVVFDEAHRHNQTVHAGTIVKRIRTPDGRENITLRIALYTHALAKTIIAVAARALFVVHFLAGCQISTAIRRLRRECRATFHFGTNRNAGRQKVDVGDISLHFS